MSEVRAAPTPDEDAEPVVFHFVQPAGSCGWAIDQRRLAWADEPGRQASPPKGSGGSPRCGFRHSCGLSIIPHPSNPTARDAIRASIRASLYRLVRPLICAFGMVNARKHQRNPENENCKDCGKLELTERQLEILRNALAFYLEEFEGPDGDECRALFELLQ